MFSFSLGRVVDSGVGEGGGWVGCICISLHFLVVYMGRPVTMHSPSLIREPPKIEESPEPVVKSSWICNTTQATSSKLHYFPNNVFGTLFP